MIIVIIITGMFAIKCVIGTTYQACFAMGIPSETLMIVAGFEMIFEYKFVRLFLKRGKK